MFTDAVGADCVRVHEPAELDEEAMRVGLLQSRAVELLQAFGGLLEAQAHAVQELSDPLSTGAHVDAPFRRAIRAQGAVELQH